MPTCDQCGDDIDDSVTTFDCYDCDGVFCSQECAKEHTEETAHETEAA